MRPWPRLYASGRWSGSGVSPAALARLGAMRVDPPPAHEPFPQTVGDVGNGTIVLFWNFQV